MTRARTPPELSVVVPLFEEEESLRPLYERIRMACDELGWPYEIVFVDDGSGDATFRVMTELQENDDRIRAVKLRRNSGQTAAMAAGFEQARGRVIVSMDGDLQNDPADIPLLLAKIDEGCDVVCGWRKNRQDKFVSRRVPSMVANWLIGHVTGVRIHDNGCSLKAYRASVIKRVSLYNEMHRFIPAMSTLAGAKIEEVVVNHHARQFGRSKYGLSRVWRVCLDIVTIKMITGFAARPAHWFGLFGAAALAGGGLALILAQGARMGGMTEEWIVLATVGLLSLFLGAHLVSLGILGELFVRTGDFSPRRILAPLAGRVEVDHGTDPV